MADGEPAPAPPVFEATLESDVAMLALAIEGLTDIVSGLAAGPPPGRIVRDLQAALKGAGEVARAIAVRWAP